MRFGFFDDQNREYVIERPDTPMPWINYLGEGEYCSIISHNAGGYSFRKSPGHGRLLRYRFNSVPHDRPGRYIYLRNSQGDYWTNSWVPVQKPLSEQKITCRHGLGYTTIQSSYKGIESKALYFVPQDENLEIWKFTIKNTTNKDEVFDIFGYAEFGVPEFSHETDLQAYLYYSMSSYENNVAAVHMNRARWDCQNGYFTTIDDVQSFDTDREKFFGMWHSESDPIAVINGKCSGSCHNGDNSCAALHIRIPLKAGEERTTAFILGAGVPLGNPLQDGQNARAKFTLQKIDEEFAQLKSKWESRVKHFSCSTPDENTNRTASIWGPYQAHINFKWSRSASFIEAGGRDGYGFRDTMQDIIGAVHTSPEKAKDLFLTLLKGQDSNGAAERSIQPLTLETGKGVIVKQVRSDDHLWILTALSAYLRETGDMAILDTKVPYLNEGEGTVYEHAKKALDFSESKKGARGLLLSLLCDWNDSLSGLWRKNGESVFVSLQYVAVLNDFIKIAKLYNKDKDVEEAQRRKQLMIDTINEQAWDGEWYARAILDNNERVGSKINKEGTIYVNPQSWAILSGCADLERGRMAMDSVKKHLATDYGVMLCTPPYTKVDWSVGGVTMFPPGLKENAAIFCHPNPWAVIAETILRRGDQAYEYFKAFMPARMNDNAELRQVEPYVYCQFIKGKADSLFGQGRNSWLTGTAAWSFIAATQYILGVRPDYNGLEIDPCIPSAWDKFSVSRIFRGAEYNISVKNPKGLCCGAKALIVNGKTIEGNLVPVFPAGSKVNVEVSLG